MEDALLPTRRHDQEPSRGNWSFSWKQQKQGLKDDAEEKWNVCTGKAQRQRADFPMRTRDGDKVASDSGIVIYSNLHGLCKIIYFSLTIIDAQCDPPSYLQMRVVSNPGE